MSYIIKNNNGLINTRLTDVGRKKLSEGSLNIKYFQVGDSEIIYDLIEGYDQRNNNILSPAYNSQNKTDFFNSTKLNIKYPILREFVLDPINSPSLGKRGYGLIYSDPYIVPVYNTAPSRGFFSFTSITNSWSANTSSAYTINSNYTIDVCDLCSESSFIPMSGSCDSFSGAVNIKDFITIFYSNIDTCGEISHDYRILTYQVSGITGDRIYLDRPLPCFSGLSSCTVSAIVYPSGMTVLYDFETPENYYDPTIYNFQNICDVADSDVKVWNMNIPWSENPAGLLSDVNEGFEFFGSQSYLGTMEYLGYHSDEGQVFYDTVLQQTKATDTFIYNSFDVKKEILPRDQKCVAIIHYTNNAVDTIYGEKFAMEPYDGGALDNTGAARNFKLHIPWLMWHKSNTGTIGETFYVDPEGYDLFNVNYIQSSINSDMNDPGIRYFHLWDINEDDNGNLNRVGKVFPDHKIVIIDDEELVAAMSYKSNRNWTLPAPRLSLVDTNICDKSGPSTIGLVSGSSQYVWVTYRFDDIESGDTIVRGALHCNYYMKIQGPSLDCADVEQDVAVSFGNEFPFLKNEKYSGFSATQFKVLCQIVNSPTQRPSEDEWRVIDFTSQLSGGTVDGYIPPSAMTSNTFIITKDLYDNADLYDLGEYVSLPPANNVDDIMNFGDEYYFYGNIETDIQATIYEMRFKCNLPQNQFLVSTNPTWNSTYSPYITEIGLFDSDFDLVAISKLSTPQRRAGTQQFLIQLDF